MDTTTPELSPPCTPCKRKSVELEEDDLSDADSTGTACSTREPTLRHFKALYDQLWDYKKICSRFFLPTHPYLAVKEHPVTNAHVHFQGYANNSEKSFKAKLGRLSKTHHLRKENKNQRPISMAKRAVTDIGFQYMCKDLTVAPLAVNLLTAEDLAAMHAKSTLLVKELKTNITNYIAGIDRTEAQRYLKGDTADDIINSCSRMLIQHEIEGKLTLPKISRHTRDSIKNGLMQMPGLNRKFKALIYVSK